MSTFLSFLQSNNFHVTHSILEKRYYELSNHLLFVVVTKYELFCDSVSNYNKTGDCPFYRRDISLIRSEYFRKLLRAMNFWSTELGIKYSREMKISFWDRDDFRN